MYENKCINLLTAGKFYFPFFLLCQTFCFFFFVIPAKEEKVLYSNKNIDKRYPNHIQFIDEILDFVKLFTVCINIKNYTGHKNLYCMSTGNQK